MSVQVIRLKTDNMRFELNIFCLLSVLSIARISDSSSHSTPNDHPQTTDSDQSVPVDGLTAVKSSDSAVERISKVFECLMNRLDEGEETLRLGCNDAFLSVWTSAKRTLIGDDNEIGGI